MSGEPPRWRHPPFGRMPQSSAAAIRLFVRVFVGGFRMAVSRLAVLACSGGVLFYVLVLAYGVMMSRLMVVMRGSVMVSGRLMVMLTRRMLWCLCHFIAPALGVIASDIAS